MKSGFRLAVSIFAASLALAGLLSGCASYRLGSMLPAEIDTVHIPVFRNATTEPLIEDEATRQTIAAFQADGSLRVTSAGNADSVLEVVLTEYEMAPIAYNRDRPSAGEEYRVILNARVLLKRTGTDEVLAENPRVQGDATFELEGDLTSSKRRALPLASIDLARDIVEVVVEYW